MVEVWEELQAQVEQLTGHAGLQIIGTILEEEVARRGGPPHRLGPASSGVRWGRQPGYVVFGGQRVSIPRPRVRSREGEEVALDSYAQLQHDGRRQRAVREGIVAGLITRNYHRVVESVLDGYGIEKSRVSRKFVQASAAQLQELCERSAVRIGCKPVRFVANAFIKKEPRRSREPASWGRLLDAQKEREVPLANCGQNRRRVRIA